MQTSVGLFFLYNYPLTFTRNCDQIKSSQKILVMWRTVRYKKNGTPLWDVNEQGKVYSYQTKTLLGKINRKIHPYLCISDGNSSVYIHRLVAQTFPEICGKWFVGCEVHHKDGNSLNNRADNLVICSKEEHRKFHLKAAARKIVTKGTDFQKWKEDFDESKPYSLKFYCRRAKARKNGLARIELAITNNNKRHFINLPFLCKPSDFSNGVYPDGFTKTKEKLCAQHSLSNFIAVLAKLTNKALHQSN